MALTYTSTGGLYKRLGLLAGMARDAVSLKGGTATTNVIAAASLTTRGSNIEVYTAESPAVNSVTDGSFAVIDSARSALAGYFTNLQSLAQRILIKQVDDQYPLPQKTIDYALAELVRRMLIDSASLNASSVSFGAQASVGSPTGTPTFVLTGYRKDGYLWQCVVPETIRFTVTADSYTGSQTARRESVLAVGALANSDTFHYQWPTGSGTSKALTLIDAQIDNTSGNNLLTNGDLETYSTTNYPDNWVFQTGAAGTDFFNDSSNPYTQTSALKWTGDGSTLLKWYQEFNHAASTSAGVGGTPAVLAPASLYCINFWGKALTSAPSAGVLRAALVDGSGTVVNDDSGGAISTTYDLTAWTTSYVAKQLFIRTPSIMPSTYRLEFKTSTATSNAKSLVIDDVACALMTALYSGGPSAAGFAGATKCVTNDAYTIAVSNTRGVMADYMERFFGLNAKGLILAYSGSPSVADSVVA